MTATGTTEPTAYVSNKPDRGARGALAAICLGFFVIQLDATIINVALPTIGHGLHGTSGSLQWIVAGYTISLAALMLTAGGLADQYGARRFFLAGMIVFAIASMACGLADDMSVLIAARVAQGVGAAMLLPCSLALIVHRFPDAKSRAKALGVWGAFGSTGMAVGPLAGGLLLAASSWRAIFLVNVPVACVACLLLWRTVTETPLRSKQSIDWGGVASGSLSLGALAGAFIEAGQAGPTAPITVELFAAGLIAGLLFIRREKHTPQPMLPPKLFNSHNFSNAVTIGFLFNFSLYGALLTMSLYLQHELRYSALAAGCALFPMALAVAVGAITSGQITARASARSAMLWGFGLACVGALIASFAGSSGGGALTVFFVGSVILGLCSLAMPAMTSIAVGAVHPGRSGLASGVFNTSRQAGGAIGVALLGSVTGVGGTILQVPMYGCAVGLGVAGLLALRVRRSEEAIDV